MNTKDGEHSEAPDVIARRNALAAIRKLSKPLPPGFKFDREEAHERSGFGNLRQGLIVDGILIVDPFLPTDKP